MTSAKSAVFQIEQGCCYLVDMNPPRKSKPGKLRPVVVIQSSDTILLPTPSVIVVPLTTQILEENLLRIHVKPSAMLKIQKPSDVLVDQIHTIDRELFLQELGTVPKDIFLKIQTGVRFLLDF